MRFRSRAAATEAVALHSAPQCPEKTGTLVLGGSQLGLQIHESVGHPIELDRVLGMEANFAGTSFLTLDKLRTLRYGSDLVNIVADARQEVCYGIGGQTHLILLYCPFAPASRGTSDSGITKIVDS